MTPQDLFLGKTVGGRYRLVERVGSGAFGTVYRAIHTRLDSPFAVKFLAANLSCNESLVGRFEREAKTTSRLKHPSIVDVVDYGEEPLLGLYLAMEFLEGQSLATHLRRHGALPPGLIAHLGFEVADGLAAAHALGVVHRDLKPANVMLVTRPSDPDHLHAKLVDFGIAGLMDDAGQGLTMTGTAVGTPTYMAPEQIRGEKVDARADLYAFGVMVYEMAVGAPPFTGRSAPVVMQMHLQDPVPPMRERMGGGEIPPQLEQIVLRCLEKDPNQRIQDARAVRTALDELARALGVFISRSSVPSLSAGGIAAVGLAETQAPPSGDPGDSSDPGAWSEEPATPARQSAVPLSTPADTAMAQAASAIGEDAGGPWARPTRRLPAWLLVVLAALVVGLAGAVVVLVVHQSQPDGDTGTRATAEAPAPAAATEPRPVADAEPLSPGAATADVAAEAAGPMDEGRPASAVVAAAPSAAPPPPDTLDAGTAGEAGPDIAAESQAAVPPAALTVRIESEPSGALVSNGKRSVGTTPFTVEIAADEPSRTYTLSLRGYERESVEVDPTELGRTGRTDTTVRLRRARPKPGKKEEERDLFKDF